MRKSVSLTIFLFIHVQTTSGILQGLRKQRIPMYYTLIFRGGSQGLLNYTLCSSARYQYSWRRASLLCCFASLVPNLYFIRKIGKVRFDWIGLLVKPLRLPVSRWELAHCFCTAFVSKRPFVDDA